MKYWFTGLLTASIIINALLIHRLYEKQQEINSLEQTVINSTDTNKQQQLPQPTLATTEHITASTTPQPIAQEALLRPQENASKEEKWQYLQFLRGQNRYEELLYEVQLFLRDFPQSLDGLMLEAEAIYYTKPLNVAIIHYYELRERDLPLDLMNEVEKFIELNSSRTIQRFSGDANWALLSAFLEPLLQVDPTNRNYIMPLAKSYGMEEQFSLMEDTLAALPFDDIRAERLRESIYARNEASQPTQTISESPESPFEQEPTGAMVRLNREDNKLMASVSVEDQPLELLVDTGASVTALKLSMQSKIAKRGEYLGIFTVQTAGGNIASPMYRVEELYLETNRLTNVAVMLLADENLGDNDGLLGMNILSKFDFVASRSSDDVYLVRK